MRSGRLARRRVHLACAIGCLSVVLSACSTGAAPTATVTGKTLTIYASAPPSAQSNSTTDDVLAAEQLAFSQSSSTIGSYKLKLVVLHSKNVSDNARTAIEDQTTIAYLGEILPGESADSIGIVGNEQILQVSPTDTAVELTQSTPAVPGAPTNYYESQGTGSRTFARVVPTSQLEARALISALQTLHVSKLFVASDGQPYGAALAYAVKQQAGSAVSVVEGQPSAALFAASGADGLLYATTNAQSAVNLFDAAAQRNRAVKLLGGSALADQQFVAALSPAAQNAFQVSAPGFLPADLTAGGRKFTADFQSAYGHAPAPEAIFGYEAMGALHAVLTEAGSNVNSRTTVRQDFFAIHNRSSVLGSYSINSNGDTNLAPFVISRVTSGRLTPYQFVREQR